MDLNTLWGLISPETAYGGIIGAILISIAYQRGWIQTKQYTELMAKLAKVEAELTHFAFQIEQLQPLIDWQKERMADMLKVKKSD